MVDAGLRGLRWESFRTSLSHVRSVAVTRGLEAARRQWIHDPLFAPAMERPQVAVRLERMVTGYSGWHCLHDQARPPSDAPPSERLDGIGVPTLVIVGERDVQDFQTIGDVLHQRIPDAAKVVMSGVGHMANNQMLRRRVDQVPVVHEACVLEVGAVDAFARLGGSAPVLLDQDQERQQPLLVPRRSEVVDHRVEEQRAVRAGEGAELRDADAEEAVALAVLARARLEEALRVGGDHRIAQGLERPADVLTHGRSASRPHARSSRGSRRST